MRKATVAMILSAFVAMNLLFSWDPGHAQVADGLPALTVVVRHADRASDDKDTLLSDKGKDRANDLKAALSDIKFSTIITSDYIRTRDTAKPLVQALGLMPIEVPYKDVDIETHLKGVVITVSKHAGGAVLVVGHSETVLEIIARLKGPRFTNNICRNTYDHLFVLVSVAGKAQLVHSRFGAASPPPQGSCM